MTTLTISLSEPLMAFLEEQVETGGYSGPSGYLSSLLDAARPPIDDSFEDSELEELLMEGLNSGEAIPITPEFWDELWAETDSIILAHENRKTAA